MREMASLDSTRLANGRGPAEVNGKFLQINFQITVVWSPYA